MPAGPSLLLPLRWRVSCDTGCVSQPCRSTVAVALVILLRSVPAAAQTPAPLPNFFSDVARDYRTIFSWDSAQWLSIGGVAALAVAEFDEDLRDATQDPAAPMTLALEAGEVGEVYGSAAIQLPLSLGLWAISKASGSTKGIAAGRDLLRAQISAVSWTFVIKYAVGRDRPNGEPLSFPSGHASATFAGAAVLQQHYGWKVGVPSFAAATLTAASRITVNKHWASDVVFGAVVGMVAGRTVTIDVRSTKLKVAPMIVRGGAGVSFSSF